MEQKPLYAVNWRDFISDEDRSLKIWGNVDKTDSQVYYTCAVNQQQIVITNFDGRWIDNSGKDHELAAKLGRLIDGCEFLLALKKS
ncbi:hypothetical protein [Mucilaginibacter paludis]|uniref:Uncharacterized protein n=1 Tax=Mucilaginibacter paludis DSM 18603 TaxID=714943 RepID=H1YDQ8_9SPHI|nr:hypothetical protein [Mucilaginibacter paludis]EHQ30747.1 hypothetical protein Mucpa_6697 [Mucilaginibacter paludis DSM 18603]